MRYARQTILPEVGVEGQAALAAAQVLCVGAGGLGSPVLLYLAAAGVGTVDVIDADRVERSNLQRQILFTPADETKSKAEIAQARLAALNPDVRCTAYPFDLVAANARALLEKYDLVVDATDNFAAKYLINDVCAALGRPWVYGSVNRWEGQCASFFSHEGPCYRCLYPREPEVPVGNCAENGVLGAAVGMVGSWQALLALQILLPKIRAPWGRLQIWDTLALRTVCVQIEKDPACPTCGTRPDTIELGPEALRISVAAWRAAADRYLALDVRTREEWERGHLPGAVHWPLSELERGHLPQTILNNLDRTLLLYCQSGARSQRAGRLLRDAGHGGFAELAGGFSAVSAG